MARDDIRVWKSPHGGMTELRYGRLTAAQVFQRGEPVGIVNAGTLSGFHEDAAQIVLADIDTVGNICGIAAWGPGEASAAADPTASVALDPKTGVAFATGALVGYYPADQGTLFITNNFFAAAAGSAVVPAITDVGEPYQMVYATFGTPDGGWGIEQTAGAYGTDIVAVVHEVLDSMYRPVAIGDTTSGVWVVFEMKTGA